MNRLIYNGMKRRRREILPVFIVTLIAVLFLTAITLFQEMMDSYLYKSNIDNYGDWVAASVDSELQHPYFAENASITSGTALINDSKIGNGFSLGMTDGDFTIISGSFMLDGSMPKASNEIAATTAFLSKSGYSYELGQTITIRYLNEDMEVQESQYVLTGVVKAYTEIWKNIYNTALPDCFVTKQEFQSYQYVENTVYYYRLNPLYNDVDTWALAQSFVEDGKNITYNSYVYDNGMWENKEMYGSITIAIGIVAAFTIGYLLVAYTHKRRPVYFKYRCIGASRLQVRKLVIAECTITTAPAIVSGIAASYLIAILIGRLVANSNNTGTIFEFNPITLLTQIGFSVLMVIIAVIITQFTISDRKIAQNTSEIKTNKFNRLRKSALKTRHPDKAFFKRQNIISPLQNIIFAVIAAIMCGCMLYCIHKLYTESSEYLDYKNYHSDFFMEKTGQYEYSINNGEVTYGGDAAYIGEGISNKEISQLDEVIGIKNVHFFTKDRMHYFEWDGMQNSQILNAVNVQHNIDYNMSGIYLPEPDSIKDEVRSRNDSQQIDWEKFEKGEQAILFINAYQFSVEDMNYTVFTEDTIKAGDILSICHSFSGIKTDVEIGAVYIFDKLSYNNDFFPTTYGIVGSRELAKRIAENEETELKYNAIEIDYNSFSSYQSTDRQLAAFAKENGFSYSSNAEFLREMYRKNIRSFAIYGSVLAVMLAAYISIYANLFETRKIYLQKQLKTLKQIGMSDKQYVAIFFKNECRNLLSQLIGIVVCYLLITYENYTFFAKSAEAGIEVFSYYLNEFTDSVKILTIESLLTDTGHWLLAAAVLVLYLLMVGGSYIAITKSVKKEA